MIWLRVLAGLLFLTWSGMVVYVAWLAIRPIPRPEDWKSEYGSLDPNSEEFRRLVESRH